MAKLDELIIEIKGNTQGLRTSLEEANRQVAGLSTGMVRQQQAIAREGSNAFSGLSSVIARFASTTESTLLRAFTTGKFAFGDMAASILQNLSRMVLQFSVLEPLKKSAGSGLGGFLGGLLGRLLPGRASGGPVSAHRPYVVGERGPELFIPRVSGGIVPNHQLGGGGVTVQQTIQISTGVAQTVRAELAAAMPQIKRETAQGVIEGIRRGGKLAEAVGVKA